ncbi:midasin, partial [Trifolium pratense]
MQLPKPGMFSYILSSLYSVSYYLRYHGIGLLQMQGSPGVGKTSLITALGKYSGHRVVRINLSEQTDMMDLLGSDLPVESDEGMKFSWSDGILLQALKEGCWVLLDELNLAPQSVLE